MEMFYKAAYDIFREEYPDFKVSKTKFRQMRPIDVQPSYRNKKRNCLGEYCANIDLRLEALSRYAASHRLQDICIKDRYKVSRLTLCPKGQTGEYKKACLDRKCDECGTATIQERLQPLLQMDESVTFYKWEIVPYQQNGAEKKKMCRLRKTISPQDFVQELVKEVKPFSALLFKASWQGCKYEEISRDPPGGWVVI